MAMVENQGRREEGAAGCHWRRQPATLAVIDGGDGGNTSVGRDVEERWEGGGQWCDVSPYAGASTVAIVNDSRELLIVIVNGN